MIDGWCSLCTVPVAVMRSTLDGRRTDPFLFAASTDGSSCYSFAGVSLARVDLLPVLIHGTFLVFEDSETIGASAERFSSSHS